MLCTLGTPSNKDCSEVFRRLLSQQIPPFPRQKQELPSNLLVLLAGAPKSQGALIKRIQGLHARNIQVGLVWDTIPAFELAFINEIDRLCPNTLIIKEREVAELRKQPYFQPVAWKSPRCAAACIVMTIQRGKPLLLIVDRKTGQPGLALPSGFLNIGESLQENAVREAYEEAGVVIDPNSLELVDVYSDPGMDPTKFVIETMYGMYIQPKALAALQRSIRPNLKEVHWARFIPLSEFAKGPVAFPRHLDAAKKYWSRIKKKIRIR